MRTVFVATTLFAAALAIGLSGCSEKNSAPEPTAKQKADAMNNAISNNSSGNVLSAPADYLGAAVKAKQNAVKTIDVAAVNSAIQQFYVAEGRFPNDLNELVSKKYIAVIPPAPVGMKLQYDSNTGEAKVVRQ